jgi:hypothetical protein
MFFNAAGSGSVNIYYNLIFDFQNTTGLPINMSLPALQSVQTAYWNSLIEGNQWYLGFITTCNVSDAYLASQCTDEVREEFLKAFNLSLAVISQTNETDNTTGYVTTYEVLETAPYDLPTTEKLLEYKPSNSFGNLITADFVSKSVLDSSIGEIEWNLTRNSWGFSWELTVTCGAAYTALSGNEKNRALVFNLNDLLNYTGTISLDESEILIDVERQQEFGDKTYWLNITDTSPSVNAEEVENEGYPTLLLTYAPPNVTSVDNVTVWMNVNSATKQSNGSHLTTAIAVTVVVLVAAVAVVSVSRKRKAKNVCNHENGKGGEKYSE